MKSEAFKAGYAAHVAGRMRIPVLDPWVTPTIKAVQGTAGAVIKLLDDWLKGWDARHFEDQEDFQPTQSSK